MNTSKYQLEVWVTKEVFGIAGTVMLDFYRQLYNTNSPINLCGISGELRIPKVIHQIWIGGPVPDVFTHYIQTWKDMHPDWEYKLWTDENIHTVNLYNQKFYDETDSPGVKSDLLKWELVYQFGGVYVDMDFECLRSLDIFHHTYDFYTGLQPLDTQFLQLGAALFGAIPGHPILKHCIETIKDDWHFHGAPTKSGPVHFTKSFYKTAGKGGFIDIALPALYFYPLGCREKELTYQKWVDTGAFAVHHWAKSWMPPKYRLKKFRNLGNDILTESWND